MSRMLGLRPGLVLLGILAAACGNEGKDEGTADNTAGGGAGGEAGSENGSETGGRAGGATGSVTGSATGGSAGSTTGSVAQGGTGQHLVDTDVTPTSANDVFDTMRTGSGARGIDKMIDGSAETYAQFRDFNDTITYQLTKPTVVTNYEITSASDAVTPERDPMDFTLEGSVNGIDWVPIDSQAGVLFDSRSQRKTFTVTNSKSLLWVRLRVTKINRPDDTGMLQIGELRIGGTAATTIPTITAIDAPVVDSNSITLSWTASGAESFILRRYSEDGGLSAEIPCSGTTYKDSNLLPGTAYAYTVQPVSGTVSGFPFRSAMRAVTPALAGGYKDLTALSDVPPTADHEDAGWPVTHITDGYLVSKWYAGTAFSTGRIRQEAPTDSVVTQYTLTSADDYPARDPKNFELWGSKDGTTFDVLLDSRENQAFYGRRATRTFSCNTSGLAFKAYELRITANNGAPDLQLAEWRLYGTTTATLAVPVKPVVTPEVLSFNQIALHLAPRTTRKNRELSYLIERATNATFTENLVTRTVDTWTPEASKNKYAYHAFNLAPSTSYYFRVTARNEAGASPSAVTTAVTTPSDPSPSTLEETGWYGNHNDSLSRIYSSPTLQVFHDEWETNATSASSIQWLTPALEEAWTYSKSLYRLYSGPQLFAILNAAGEQPTHEAYEVGGALYSYKAENGYRNSIFTMSDEWNVADYSDWRFRSLIHELNHVVESNNNETMNSPSYNVWGDSRWGEIFMYDVYKHLASVPSTGVTLEHAEELRTTWWEARDEFGGLWLQNWYYPIYSGTLGNKVDGTNGSAFLAKYFELLARYYPKTANMYARNMNLGEYIHFCSAAAGIDLSSAASTAFRLDRRPMVEAQIARAQIDFPEVAAMYLPNRKPGFTFENIARTGTVGKSLSGATLAGTATDPDVGATLTYTKVSGPSWLTIATNGALSGTPTSAGDITAQVRVTDKEGLADTATLLLKIGAAR
ncbi:MAG: hypothetical protein QM784_13825 [Polyangiaceae bacterium]